MIVISSEDCECEQGQRANDKPAVREVRNELIETVGCKAEEVSEEVGLEGEFGKFE